MIELINTGYEDEWGNPIYHDKNKIVYKDIDWNDEKPNIHTVTDLPWQEPDYPIKDFKIVDRFSKIL